MPSIYTRFATLPTKLVARGVNVGGPSFTGTRSAGGTPATAPTISNLSSRTLVFVAAALEANAHTFPEVLVWKAPWLLFALSNVDVRAGDTYTDGSVSYVITGEPVTHYGFLLAPARSIPTVVAVVTGGGYRAPLWILGIGAA